MLIILTRNICSLTEYLNLFPQKSRKKAVLDAYQSAEKYCKTSGCRRKFVLEYFGEMTSYDNCGG